MPDVIYNSLGEILVSLVVLVLIPWLIKLLNIKMDDSRRQYMEAAIAGAIRAGVAAYADKNNRTPKDVLDAMVNDPTARNNVVNFAESYLRDNVPKAIDKLGMNERLADVVTARFDTAVGEMASKIRTTAQTVTETNADTTTPRP